MGKKVLALIAGILLLAGICQAQPFLVCDPQPNVREYELDIDGTIITGIQAELDYSLKYPSMELLKKKIRLYLGMR